MDLNLQLKPDSRPVDAGVIIPTVNDNFVGKAPDLGAHEVGAAKIKVRATLADLGAVLSVRQRENPKPQNKFKLVLPNRHFAKKSEELYGMADYRRTNRPLGRLNNSKRMANK